MRDRQKKWDAEVREWLQQALQGAGVSQVALQKQLGLPEGSLSKVLKGERRLKEYEIDELAEALKTPPPAQKSLVQVAPSANVGHIAPVKSIAAAGRWLDPGARMTTDAAPVPRRMEPKFKFIEQYSLRVEGTDFNKIFHHGEYVVFAPFKAFRAEPLDGDIVHVERLDTRKNLIEHTIRRVRVDDAGQVTLWPESDDPEWQTPIPYPLFHKNEKLTIKGFYVGSFRPNPQV
jgi:transcriptional regulator with XRE-family HTH domain